MIYKHLPLSNIHPESTKAAQASWAAQQQGKFWEYHDALFQQQNRLGENLYQEIAKQLNLDLDKFNLDRKKALELMLEDLRIAQSLNINETPFFITSQGVFTGVINLEILEKMLADSQINPVIDPIKS